MPAFVWLAEPSAFAPAALRALMEFRRSTTDAHQMGGVPCLRGLWIPVATVVSLVAEGQAVERILALYPLLVNEAARRASPPSSTSERFGSTRSRSHERTLSYPRTSHYPGGARPRRIRGGDARLLVRTSEAVEHAPSEEHLQHRANFRRAYNQAVDRFDIRPTFVGA
jgi:uncharacterized protein (DUF433 family)